MNTAYSHINARVNISMENDSNRITIVKGIRLVIPCLLLSAISIFEINGISLSLMLAIYFLLFVYCNIEDELLLLLFNIGFAFDIQQQIFGIPFLAVLQGVYILRVFIKTRRINSTILMFLMLTFILQLHAIASCELPFKAILVFILNILLAYCICSSEHYDFSSCCLAYSIGIVVVLIASIVREPRFFLSTYFRFEGIWNDQNFLGMFCSLAIILLYFWWRIKQKMLLPFLSAEAFLLYCAYRTYSMTFIFSCALIIVIITTDLYSDRKLKASRILIPLFIFILLFLFYNYVYSGIIASRGRAIYSAGEDWTHGRVRDTLAVLHGWRASLPNILFGIGINNSPSYIGYAAHNTYVEILCQTGVLGTIAFLMYIIIVFKRNLVSIKRIHLSKSAYIYILLLYMATLSMESTDALYLLFGLALSQMKRIQKISE